MAKGFVISKDGALKRYKGRRTDVVIPDGVTEVSFFAFYNRKKVTSVTIPNGVTKIGVWAFFGCENLADVSIPDSVTEIGEFAFASCDKLKNLKAPAVVKLGKRAFTGCEGLADENGLVIVGDVLYGYYGHGGEIVVPDGVRKIEDFAFSLFPYNEKMTGVIIPDSVKEIGEEAFSHCEGLADGNGFVIVRDVLYGYYGPGGDVTVPDGVTKIDGFAFSHKETITGVTIPGSVTAICTGAFCGCKNLKSVSIPDSVTEMGSMAFSDCDGLADDDGFAIVKDVLYGYFGNEMEVKIPDGVKEIGISPFGYKKYKSITVPDSVTKIDEAAFCCRNKPTVYASSGSYLDKHSRDFRYSIRFKTI